LGLWIVVIVGFFSASTTKQDLYVLPFVAAAAPLVGGLVDALGVGTLAPGVNRLARWLTGVMAAATGVLGAAAAWFLGVGGHPLDLPSALPMGLLAVAGAAATLALVARRRERAAVLALAAMLVAVQATMVVRTLPEFERYKPVPRLAQAIRDLAAPDAPVGTYAVAVPSLVFYLERHVTQLFEVEQVRTFFQSRDRAYCVLPERDYQRVKGQLGVPTRVVAAAPRYDGRFLDFLERRPAGHLLLVTNDAGHTVAR
jgi:4-amino-4-deoxy-L-arabinose transferase-like glycosyltransferase